jgi:hypothetical protein
MCEHPSPLTGRNNVRSWLANGYQLSAIRHPRCSSSDAAIVSNPNPNPKPNPNPNPPCLRFYDDRKFVSEYDRDDDNEDDLDESMGDVGD